MPLSPLLKFNQPRSSTTSCVHESKMALMSVNDVLASLSSFRFTHRSMPVTSSFASRIPEMSRQHNEWTKANGADVNRCRRVDSLEQPLRRSTRRCWSCTTGSSMSKGRAHDRKFNSVSDGQLAMRGCKLFNRLVYDTLSVSKKGLTRARSDSRTWETL